MEDNTMNDVYIFMVLIPMTYIILYLLKGKNKSFKGAGNALTNAIRISFTAWFYETMFMPIFNIENFFSINVVNVVMLICFSMPFLMMFVFSLIAGIREDFCIKLDDIAYNKIKTIILLTMISFIIAFVEIAILSGLISGSGTLPLFLTAIFFIVVEIFVVKKMLENSFGIEIKISENFIACLMMILLVLIFITLCISSF